MEKDRLSSQSERNLRPLRGQEPRTRQCKPNCCPFKDYKGIRKDNAIFICDIPLEDRYKFIDPEQNINHPCMKVVGHCKNKLVNPLETTIQEQAKTINTMLEHLKQLTTAVNNLSK